MTSSRSTAVRAGFTGSTSTSSRSNLRRPASVLGSLLLLSAGATSGHAQGTYELRCRGGDEVSIDRTADEGKTIQLNLGPVRFLNFKASTRAAGADARGLEPGTCSWIDRPLSDPEPRQVRFTLSEDQANARPQFNLRDPDKYWSFFVFNTNQGYFEAASHKEWIWDRAAHGDIIARRPGIDATAMKQDPLAGMAIGNRHARILLTEKGVSGEVRWKKEYGLPYNSQNDGRPVHPYPCQVFRVHSTAAVINKLGVRLPRGLAGDAGTFSGADFGRAGTPPEDGDYYVCHFTVTDLPLDRTINVQVEIDPSFLPPGYTGFDPAIRLTAPWVGGAEPQPPSGQQRRIMGNTQTLLTEKEPRARLVFEMVYAP